MKITDVRTYVMSAPVKTPYSFSQGWIRNRTAMLTEVITDEGISGWGEALCQGLQPPEIAASVVESSLKPLLIGEDPNDTEVLWDIMYNQTKDYGQKGAVIGAISSVDIALWDIKGKFFNMPVYKMLGGAYRQKIKTYATGFYRKDNSSNIKTDWLDEAQKHIKEGFFGIKLKIGLGVKEDKENIYAVRKAIGEEPLVMIDANHGYNFINARKLAQSIEELDISWFEEPLSPEFIEGYIELKKYTSIPLACGENEFTRFGFKKWITNDAVDILQPNTCGSGGFTECKRILSMATAWGINYIPHCWGTAIGLAAALHMLAIIPSNPISIYNNSFFSEPLLEYDSSSHPFRNELINKKIYVKNGYTFVPEGPGLGIEVNRNIIDLYSN